MSKYSGGETLGKMVYTGVWEFTMVKHFTISENKLVPTEEIGIVQVFVEPTMAEQQELKALGIGDHNIASALDPDELARLEYDENHLVLILNRPRNYSSKEQLLFNVTSVGLFLFTDRLILLSGEELDLQEGKPLGKIKDLKDATLRILGGFTSHFLGHLKVINLLSDSLEQRINQSMENRFLINMFTLEKSLVFFLNGIGGNQTVLEKLKLYSTRIGLGEHQQDILEDVIIENQQCNKQAEIYSNILTGLMDARGSIVNNNLNLLIKRLTIVNVVFMPLNLLAGVGGMSEFTTWTSGAPWWVAYPLFLLGLSGLGLITYKVLQFTTGERPGKNHRG